MVNKIHPTVSLIGIKYIKTSKKHNILKLPLVKFNKCPMCHGFEK